MGKIVKYCSTCDEGFVEKFGFCPNCGATLQAFEMSPVMAEASPVIAVEPPPAAPVVEPTAPVIEPSPVVAAPVVVEAAPIVAAPEPEPPLVIAEPAPPAPVVAAAPVAAAVVAPAAEVFSAPVPPKELVTEFTAPTADPEPAIEMPAAEPVKAKPAAAKAFATSVAAAAPTFVQKTPVDVDAKHVSLEAEHNKYTREGGFYVTVIEEKNVRQRNLLLVGALGFMVASLMTATLYNLFSKDLDVGSINDDIFNAVIVDDVPAVVEEEKQQKKDKDAGGGGGGGRKEEETTQGDLANQTKNPVRPPEAMPRMENPSLVLPPASTQGNKTFEQKFDKFGDPNGRFSNFNNGSGSGGGQGNGTGTGQGSGRGTGAGSGSGSGYGSGLGNGNGSGTGDGQDGLAPPPPHPVGVTQGIKILSKPRPGYTDSARQANIQGTVLLRVTFLASGQIGSISPVKGLGNGLTEQAIAAARRISFEPAKTNGVAQSVTKQIEYTFSIY